MPLDSEVEPIARLVLQCLTHFFSWIPLSNHVTPQLMELIFRFVGMGTELSLPQVDTSNGMFAVFIIVIDLNLELISIHVLF